jgi:hypothetical protein
MDMELNYAKQRSSNNPVLAMWLLLTTYNTQLHDKRTRRCGWNWRWFEAFCTELDIDSIFTLVNLPLERAQAYPRWSELSVEPREFLLSTIFGMTPQDLLEETNCTVLDLCEFRSLDFSVETQRAVALEVYMQAYRAFCEVSWCSPELRRQLLHDMPEPDIKW